MGYDIFVLVWGGEFVRDFVRWSLPSQLADGNIPALSRARDVRYHIYTDRESDTAFRPGIEALSEICDLHFHYFDEIEIGGAQISQRAQGLDGPDYKYQIQRLSMRHLFEAVGDDPDRAFILFDSNILLSDGALAAVHQRRQEGWKAIAVNALRMSQERMVATVGDGDLALSSPALVKFAIDHFHRLGADSFIDAENFSPYPSQLYWRVGEDGIAGRNFIPHPLMVCNAPGLRNFQSTADYDLALRAWADDQVMLIGDSDEAVFAKYSSDRHIGSRQPGPAPTPQNLALFLLTSTNHRHRRFADTPIRFHAGDCGAEWSAVETTIESLIADSYAEIDRIAANAGSLDARFMMYLKSHLGPIEDYTSPQLEPAALAQLGTPPAMEARP